MKPSFICVFRSNEKVACRVPGRKTTTKNLPWTLTSEQLWQSLRPVLEAGKSVILQNQDQETTLSLDPWNWKIVDFSAYKILVHSAQFAKVISDSDQHVVSFYRYSKWTKDSLPKGAKPGKSTDSIHKWMTSNCCDDIANFSVDK